jgi:hypothetical protein
VQDKYKATKKIGHQRGTAQLWTRRAVEVKGKNALPSGDPSWTIAESQ